MTTIHDNDSFEYEGPFYLRPVGRGLTLDNLGSHLEEEVEALIDPEGHFMGSGRTGRIRINIEILEVEEYEE